VAYTLLGAPLRDKSVEKLVFVNNVSLLLGIKDHRLNDVRCATQCDPIMCELKNIITNGWRNRRTQAPQSIVSYYNCRDELTVQDGVMFRGERIVNPLSMRQEIKHIVHAGHMEINSCLR